MMSDKKTNQTDSREKPSRQISVRNLVEFILRQGDICSGQTASADVDAMQAGSKMHTKIQARGGSCYQSEVTLKIELDIECAILTVLGRADGIITGALPKKWLTIEWEKTMQELLKEEEGLVTIDEIKCSYQSLFERKQPDPLHLAQAKCYAYIYARQNNMSRMMVQMTYVDLETEETKRFHYLYSYAELEKWFVNLIWEYSRFVSFEIAHQSDLVCSAVKTEFPFAFRPGQRELSAVVYSSIKRKERLFVQAPTGVGKTLSTVFPAVKALGEKIAEKIFYLTAKTITRTVAEESFALLRKQGLKIKTVTISAKDKLCILEERNCNPDSCVRAKGHYDRINECLYELLTNEENINRERIEEYAQVYCVCPYELSLDVSNWVDAVICDYNYLFDPKVRLKRFFSEQAVKGKYLFLIDEAHNLVERGRDMYSAELLKSEILSVKRKLVKYSKKAVNVLERLNKQMLSYSKEIEKLEGKKYIIKEGCSEFYLQLMRFCAHMEKMLENHSDFSEDEEIMDFYFKVHHFVAMYSEMDDNYVIYTEKQGKEVILQLFCVNPSAKLIEIMQKGVSTILFSATLLPVSYYKNLLTGEPEDKAVYIPSPFPQKNRFLAIASGVTSRYRDRNYEQYERIVEYIRLATKKAGNYMVFFSSYKMMEEVYDVAVERGLSQGRRLRIQQNHMTEIMREEFLLEFQKQDEKPLLAFCILGGIFSEGIDLKQEQLIGALIVGNGLPQVCTKRDILNSYFREKGLDGFSYAYVYPGMNKVLQAAGRVIRTDTDSGIILLMDDRFKDGQYRSLFPKEWSDCRNVNVGNVSLKIQKFWDSFEEDKNESS